jgi:hypothetical protein
MMNKYKQRLIEEQIALDAKRESLERVTHDKKFNLLALRDANAVMRQLGVMREYSSILSERIGAFEGDL